MKGMETRWDRYLVKVPNLENGFVVEKWVLEEAVSCWECKMVAFWDGTVRVNELFKKIKVVTAHRVTHVDRSPTDGT